MWRLREKQITLRIQKRQRKPLYPKKSLKKKHNGKSLSNPLIWKRTCWCKNYQKQPWRNTANKHWQSTQQPWTLPKMKVRRASLRKSGKMHGSSDKNTMSSLRWWLPKPCWKADRALVPCHWLQTIICLASRERIKVNRFLWQRKKTVAMANCILSTLRFVSIRITPLH